MSGSATLDPYATRTDYGRLRFLHGLNPLAKVAATAPAIVLVLFVRDLWTPLALIVVSLLILLLGAKLRSRMLVIILVGGPIVTALMGLSFSLWVDKSLTTDSVTLFSIGEFHYTVAAVVVGLATALRLVSLMALALISGVTTTGPDLIRSLVEHLHLPYRIGYTALAAYRFIPRFGHELEVIRQAHRVRGMAGGRGPIAGIRRYLGYVVPLLAGAIRHAERVSLAMDSRAFGAHPTRTERYSVPFRSRDWIFIGLFWLFTVVLFTV